MITSFKRASLSNQVLPQHLDEAIRIRIELEKAATHQLVALDESNYPEFRKWKEREIELQTQLNQLKDEFAKVQRVIDRMEEIGADSDVIRRYHIK